MFRFIRFKGYLIYFLLVSFYLLVPKAAFAVSSTAVQGCTAPNDYFSVTNTTKCMMLYSFTGDRPWLAAGGVIGSGSFSCGTPIYCTPLLYPGETGTVRVYFYTYGLSPGTYHGTINVSYYCWSSGCVCGEGSYTIDATLTIIPPDFIVSPQAISATGTSGCRIDSKTFTVTNLNPCAKSYDFSKDQPWLGSSPVLEQGGFLPLYGGGFYLDSGKTGRVNVSFSSGLTPGTYHGMIIVKSGEITKAEM